MGGGSPSTDRIKRRRKIISAEEFYSTEYPTDYETGIKGYES